MTHPTLDDAGDFDSDGNLVTVGPAGRDRRAGLLSAAEARLLELAEDGKSELVRGFDGFVLLAHEFAATVDSKAGGPVAGYLRQAAQMLTEFQDTLRDKPVEELLDDGRAIIRRSPQAAIGVAVVAGFLAARIVKSGSGRS